MVEVEGTFVYRRPKPETAPALPLADALPRVTGKYTVIIPAEPIRAGATPGTSMPPSRKASPPASKPPQQWRQMGERSVATPTSPAGEQFARSSRRPPEEVIREAAQVDQHRLLRARRGVAAEAHEEEPEDLAAQLTLGNAYSLMGRSADADAVFAEASTRAPLCVEVRVYGAVAAMQAGDFERARGELGKALFLEPTLALAHYLAAQVAERLGDQVSARRSYRNAIAQLRFPQRPLAGYYPEILEGPELISRAAKYALAALEEAS